MSQNSRSRERLGPDPLVAGQEKADPARGSGLTGLRDRVEALGGRLALASPPGGGTVLRVELALDGGPGPPG